MAGRLSIADKEEIMGLTSAGRPQPGLERLKSGWHLNIVQGLMIPLL